MKVTDVLSRSLFWDVNPDKLEWEKNRQLIIERVLTRGHTKEFETIISRYSKAELKEAVLKSKTLDKKTANYMSIILSIPLSSINVAPEYY